MARPRQDWSSWREANYERLRKKRARHMLNPEARENRKVDRDYHPPAWVLAERDRAVALGPVDVTAWICGDPLPGRSAFDREMLECLLAAE